MLFFVILSFNLFALSRALTCNSPGICVESELISITEPITNNKDCIDSCYNNNIHLGSLKIGRIRRYQILEGYFTP